MFVIQAHPLCSCTNVVIVNGCKLTVFPAGKLFSELILEASACGAMRPPGILWSLMDY